MNALISGILLKMCLFCVVPVVLCMLEPFSTDYLLLCKIDAFSKEHALIIMITEVHSHYNVRDQ